MGVRTEVPRVRVLETQYVRSGDEGRRSRPVPSRPVHETHEGHNTQKDESEREGTHHRRNSPSHRGLRTTNGTGPPRRSVNGRSGPGVEAGRVIAGGTIVLRGRVLPVALSQRAGSLVVVTHRSR